jgi:C4-dicarboxylate transporter DctM subunit
MIVTLFITFAISLLIGIPVAVSIGLTSLVVLLTQNVSLVVLPQRMFAGCDSFPVVAVPFFILAGDILARGKISETLVQFAESIIGFLKGGLWLVSIMACSFFSAISGVSAATTAAIGTPLLPELKKRGYDPDRSAALVATGGCIGVIIPPSIPMVLYAVMADQSVTRLFLNGFFPGILMTIALCGVALYIAYKRNYPQGAKFSFKNIWASFKKAIWGLMMPLIILGGIFSGVFTPSEAAVIAVDYALLVAAFVYKDLKWKDMFRILSNSVITMAVVVFIIATSSALSWIMANWQIPNQIAEMVLGLTSNKYVLLLLIDMVILVAGIFMETASALIIITPVFLPLITQLGVDLAHFGVVMVIGLAIGMITPPVAICLYVSSTVSGIAIEKISRAVIPFLIAAITVLLLYTYLPLLFPALII